MLIDAGGLPRLTGLVLIAGEIVAEGGGEGGVLLLFCEVEGLLRDGDGLGVVAGF
jgi:hypothetical protein